MFDFFFSTLGKGTEKLRSNPQLVYTVIVALLIIGAFVFMAERFVGIANDAQERLVNVRVGSLQDAFVSFAGDRLSETEYLETRIDHLIEENPTIQSFKIVNLVASSTTSTSTPVQGYLITASHDRSEVGTIDPSAQFLYTLASSDPEHSLTLESTRAGERLFETARAITSAHGGVVAVVITTQTLSEADKAIQSNIRNSTMILIVVLVLIMLLFVRHSKVIDYMALYKKLTEVDHLKDDFISMASHELRTPLSIIRGYAEFIREAPELTGPTKEYASKIDVSVQQLDVLVADILDVSRIEQGRMTFDFSTVAPQALVSEITESFTGPGKEKGLTVSFDATKVSGEQQIRVDQSRLRQVLLNIIGNAVKYTLVGSVTVSQYQENNRIVIRISDTGLGMSEEERAKLFTKFYRIRTKETENIRGTGLGLWITAQIVKEMQGTLSVESIKGVGSHFVLSFPQVHV